MSFTEPSKKELDFLAILLRLGGRPSLEKVELKSNGKGIELYVFLEEWKTLIKVQSDGNDKRVIIDVKETRIRFLEDLWLPNMYIIKRQQKKIEK